MLLTCLLRVRSTLDPVPARETNGTYYIPVFLHTNLRQSYCCNFLYAVHQSSILNLPQPQNPTTGLTDWVASFLDKIYSTRQTNNKRKHSLQQYKQTSTAQQQHSNTQRMDVWMNAEEAVDVNIIYCTWYKYNMWCCFGGRLYRRHPRLYHLKETEHNRTAVNYY